MPRIATIVEGRGEVEAAPVLLRRIAERVSPGSFLETPRPFRVQRYGILRGDGLERVVALVAARAGANGGVLLLLDANGDCPGRLAPRLLERAAAARPDRNVRIVLARVEFEAWFLAAAKSLAGKHGIDEAIAPPDDPEAIRDAKGWLSAGTPRGRPYRETIHQARFAATFDMDAARSAAPSFDKPWRDVSSLLG